MTVKSTLLVLAVAAAAGSASARTPDLGPNVLVVGPKDDPARVQADIDRVYASQHRSEFGPGRYAILLEPGTYHLDIPVGYYTQVSGLGRSPDDVHILGDVHSDAALDNNNATTTFWRGVDGVHVTPPAGAMQWAVSQATWLRRVHVSADITLHQKGGWASGGWISDAVIDGAVNSGSQQQWLSRNTDWKAWNGANWNMVFVGVPKSPAGDFPHPPYTRVDKVPVLREKPYLYKARGTWAVFVPAMTRATAGAQWPALPRGRTVPLTTFHIARPGTDTAKTMNAALRAGKNLLLTPGIYDLSDALHVTHADTVVMGLGFATLHPVAGTAALKVDDVDGVSIAGLLIDAGPVKSDILAEIGTDTGHRPHAKNPIALYDVFFRDGGAGPGRVGTNLVVHADHTLIDHTWIWRADHGANVGWTDNLSDTGLKVTGNDVTVYGLFVEHHQKYQVDWAGERGRVYFYQSELPYDAPDQASWQSAPGVNGWASYKVENTVHDHQAWGLGVYSVFTHPGVNLTCAVEAPQTPAVQFHHVTTVSLVNRGEITHLVNDAGEATVAGPPRIDRTLTEYPVGK